MAKILIDQFHLSFYVSRGLAAKQCEAIQATLDDLAFQTALLRAIRATFRQYRSLTKVRTTLTR